MDWNNTIAFICGPEIMMRFVLEELLDLGMKENEIYISMERNMKCAVGICAIAKSGRNLFVKMVLFLNFLE